DARLEREAAEGVERAMTWLRTEEFATHNRRVHQLLGLIWGGESARRLEPRVQRLRSEQRRDGGWAQLPGLESDAWATGEALVALHEAGIRTSDTAYRRGVDFLLRTQFDDGSWWVRTRA